MLTQQLTKLMQHENLSKEQCKLALNALLNIDNEAQASAFLALLHAKQETTEELSAFVETFREQMIAVNTHKDALDIVGTGGDGKNTVNISSATSLVCASLNVPTLKHGNNSVSSNSGSADFFQSLGIPLESDLSNINRSLNTMNFAFLYAPHFHPALKKVASIRKKLKLRSTFNLIGPLLNPASPSFQLIGVYKPDLLQLYAQLLSEQNIKRALVVHSCGLDEISLLGETQIYEINHNKINHYTITPKDFNLNTCELEEIQGLDAATNKSLILNALSGQDNAIQDTLVINAGAALYTAQHANSIADGIELARNQIKQGKVIEYINQLQDYYKQVEK